RDPRAARHEHRPVDGNVGLELGADQRDQRLALEMQIGTEHGELERRGARVIADERVGERERQGIHRAAGTEAHMLVAVATHVLHRHQQARAQHGDAHWLISFWNSARETGLKRTRSPAAKRLGSWRSASNTTSGVRPMMPQPPEMAYG